MWYPGQKLWVGMNGPPYPKDLNGFKVDRSVEGLVRTLAADVHSLGPDLSSGFDAERGLCETEGDFRSLIARWDRIVCRERRRLSQCELRE